MFLPQRPYMALGGLANQIIYPDEVPQNPSPLFYQKLESLLKKVNLHHIIEHTQGDWEISLNWEDILSLGELQRVAMARLFYHSPKIAIMDECTSALDIDLERKMYEICKELGITYIRY